ncbi:MAG: ornithine cyclodeaminase family protein [Bacteroidota bacterium]
MHTKQKHTLVLSSKDVQQITLNYGFDKLMDDLIARLKAFMAHFDPQKTIIPIRSGFNYLEPYTGLVEWMPLHAKGEKVSIKVVGYHPDNPKQFQLPTILSTISTYDTQTGHLSGIMDGVFVTALRTGAASAVASELMGKTDSKVLGLIGCGAQAVTQLHGISRIFDLEEVLLYDVDPSAMYSLQDRCAVLDLKVKFTSTSIENVVQSSDIITTATSIEVGEGPLFSDLTTKPHLHINGVGADFPGKVEIPLDFLHQSFVCPDFKEQAFIEGECQRLKPAQVNADIIAVMKETAKYEHLKNERTVYDSTGWALQDHVVMELFMEYAKELGVGQYIQIENAPEDAKNPYSFAEENNANNLIKLAALASS